MNNSILLMVLAPACAAHLPPLPVTTLPAAERTYLAEAPTGIIGQLHHVRDGMWCSDDDAFAISVVPFLAGPTEVHDSYEGWGATSVLDMSDSRGSIVQILRTREYRPADEVMRLVARDVQVVGAGEEELRTEWVIQNGLKQLQQVNASSGYQGPQNASLLDFGQHIARGTYETCRVDRHFTGAGYYFHIIAVALKPLPKETACPIAMEMASWTVAHLKAGEGCGPRMQLPAGLGDTEELPRDG